jgi:hypothetical protein|tara:strand:- start:349 stop:1092 length:744 start_codon:yes stop_codon:yes gene_type:complete
MECCDFSNNKLYFIHIPKTSGSSINKCKALENLGHCFNVPNVYRTPCSKKGLAGWKTDYFPLCKSLPLKRHILTIIRNPFDMLASYYHHRNPPKLNNNTYNESGWGAVNYKHNFQSFKEFIKAYCDINFEWHVPALHKFLYSQLFDTNGKCVADIIMKYEFRSEGINILNKKLHPTKQIPSTKHKNKGQHNKNYKEYYDKEMIKLVEKKCSRELKYFNYNFNGSTNKDIFIFNCNIKYDLATDKIIE